MSITVGGKVQGVFFRKYTIDAAKKYGISGFVKNTNEGNVYIEATGEIEMINEFINWCHKGSPLASVDSVEVIEIPTIRFPDFSVRY